MKKKRGIHEEMLNEKWDFLNGTPYRVSQQVKYSI